LQWMSGGVRGDSERMDRAAEWPSDFVWAAAISHLRRLCRSGSAAAAAAADA